MKKYLVFAGPQGGPRHYFETIKAARKYVKSFPAYPTVVLNIYKVKGVKKK